MEDSIFSNRYLTKELNISTNCLVCGEPVPMERIGDAPKICNECKNAILKMRENVENGNHIIHISLRDQDLNKLKGGEDIRLNNIRIGPGHYADIIVESPWTPF